MDWDNLRFFLAVARHGSLTAASRELDVAQTTVGRRLAALEAGLGTRLLERTPDGYLLTAAGENVRVQAERIEAETQALVRSAGEADAGIQGQVRIACSESIATNVLGPRMGDMHVRHPGLLIEIYPYVQRLSLSMREADIALQTSRPDRNELVTRRIGRVAYGLYASHSYLDRFGVPDLKDGCAGHSIMTLMGDPDSEAQADWTVSVASRGVLGLRTASHGSLVAAASAGGGLACLPRFQGDRQIRLRLLPTISPPKGDIWMLVHNDKRRSPRIAAVMSAISDAVKSVANLLDPPR